MNWSSLTETLRTSPLFTITSHSNWADCKTGHALQWVRKILPETVVVFGPTVVIFESCCSFIFFTFSTVWICSNHVQTIMGSNIIVLLIEPPLISSSKANCPLNKRHIQAPHLWCDIQSDMTDTDILWLCTGTDKTWAGLWPWSTAWFSDVYHIRCLSIYKYQTEYDRFYASQFGDIKKLLCEPKDCHIIEVKC